MPDIDDSSYDDAAALTGVETTWWKQASATVRVTIDKIRDYVRKFGGVVTTVSGASYDLLAADQGKYLRLTNAAAKSINVRPNATEALPADAEWQFRNVGAGDATLVAGSGVTIHPPAGGSLVVPQNGTVTLKRVASDEFDLAGLTS